MTDDLRSIRPRSIAQGIKDHVLLLFGFICLMWAIEALDILPFLHLDRYGIRPRSVSGLAGIVTAPFLHAGFGHLILNSLPFIVLGGTVLLNGVRVFWGVTIFVAVAGGFGVWLFAEKFSNHIGASSLIFGYLGFLLSRAVFEKSFPATAIALIVLVGYGGLLAGLLPAQTAVSWQGHLFGFLAGIGAARFLVKTRSRSPGL